MPIANKVGKIKPYELDSTTGIRDTKYNTNIVGQKASEKLNPNKKDANGLSRWLPSTCLTI